MKQNEFDTEAKALREVKKRIRHALSNIVESECHSCGYIVNDQHSISFTLKGMDFYFKGEISTKEKL